MEADGQGNASGYATHGKTAFIMICEEEQMQCVDGLT
jgi:hypothetical protein